jgi:hypothetical protein
MARSTGCSIGRNESRRSIILSRTNFDVTIPNRQYKPQAWLVFASRLLTGYILSLANIWRSIIGVRRGLGYKVASR